MSDSPSAPAPPPAGASGMPPGSEAGQDTTATPSASTPLAAPAPTPASETDGSPSSTGPSSSPALDYAKLYEQHKGKPCRVYSLNQLKEGFNGGTFRTRAALIERELNPISQASTLEEVHAALEQAGQNLAQLGVFSNINFLVHEEPLDEPEACSVEVQLEERNWYKLHAATYLQGGESTFELGGDLSNALGWAERLSANAEYGMEASHTAGLGAALPKPGGLPLVLELRGSQATRNNAKASSYVERLTGVVLGAKSASGLHALHYELGWRSLSDPSRQASKAVLAQVGDYLKSSLRYTFMLDRRASPLGAGAGGAPGWALRSVSEVCGLGPHPEQLLRYAKQQLDGALHLPLDEQGAVALSAGASAGLLLPWGGEAPLSRATCIADRFFLGGPSSLRGFGFKGVGPTDVRRPSQLQRALGEELPAVRRDALGGDAYASIFASLLFRLPHPALQALGVHGHAWVNGGNVIQVAGSGRSAKQLLADFGGSVRWTCGFGVLVPTPFGRFEVNYCVALSSQEHDRLKRGLQLGFAASGFGAAA